MATKLKVSNLRKTVGFDGQELVQQFYINSVKTPYTSFDGTWPAENDPTNPDSTPAAVDSFYQFFKTVWNCDDWLTWHRAMVAKYGEAEAKRRFLSEWNKQSIVATKKFSCESAYAEYWQKNFGQSNSAGHAIYSTGKAEENVVKGAASAVTTVADTAGFVGKNLKWFIGGGVLLALVIGLSVMRRAA